jgi:RNA polymerase sigma-70 factor, ECF subfamily
MEANLRDQALAPATRPATDFLGWVSRLARDQTVALARAARREGLGPDDALDAVQEAFQTFLLLPEARALAEVNEKARKLLVALVRNAARNMRRLHHRAAPHHPLDEVAEQAADQPTVDELIGRAEEHLRLSGCIDRLAELQRRVVTLRALDQLSGLEAAEALDLPPGHVAVLLHRARKALLACLVG